LAPRSDLYGQLNYSTYAYHPNRDRQKYVVVNFVITGAGIGGMNGLYNGLIETKAAQLTGAVRRTQYVLLICSVFDTGCKLLLFIN